MNEYYQWRPISKTHMQFYHHKNGIGTLVKEPIEMDEKWRKHFEEKRN